MFPSFALKKINHCAELKITEKQKNTLDINECLSLIVIRLNSFKISFLLNQSSYIFYDIYVK